MKKQIVMGIDTSNYTTSVALVDTEGELLANLKLPLPVKEGERGLRQSDAVFAHIKNLPVLMDEARKILAGEPISCVGVSTRPRNKDGSYMPCFLAGVNAASAVSSAGGVPLFEFSHQCGHIMAALYSARREIPEHFAAFHISGGTTELVEARATESGFVCESVGGTLDLNAGQIIDRIGVRMGFSFPAGRYMEEAALSNTDKIPRKKPPVDGTAANLSGLENMAIRLYEQTAKPSLVAAFVFDYLGRAIEMMCDAYIEKKGRMPFVFAGGVMSNSIIRERLTSRFDAAFAEPSLSCDNAVGIAVLAKNAYNFKKGF